MEEPTVEYDRGFLDGLKEGKRQLRIKLAEARELCVHNEDVYKADLAAITEERNWLKTECLKVKQYSKDMEQHYMADLAAAEKDAKEWELVAENNRTEADKTQADLKLHKNALEQIKNLRFEYAIRLVVSSKIDKIADKAINPNKKPNET